MDETLFVYAVVEQLPEGYYALPGISFPTEENAHAFANAQRGILKVVQVPVVKYVPATFATVDTLVRPFAPVLEPKGA